MNYKFPQVIVCIELRNSGMYYCLITDILNKYITPKVLKETITYHNGNYLCVPDGSRNVAFRYPGATRGHIEMNINYRVERFVFYDIDGLDSIYGPGVVEELNTLIGSRMTFVKTRKEH